MRSESSMLGITGLVSGESDQLMSKVNAGQGAGSTERLKARLPSVRATERAEDDAEGK